MRKLWLVVKREYVTRVRTRGFILSTVGVPLFSVGIFAVSLALATRASDRPLRIAIVDNAGGIAPQIMAGLSDKLPNGQGAFQLVNSWDRPQFEPAVLAALRGQIRAGSLDAYLVLPKGILQGESAVLHTRNSDDFQTNSAIRHALNSAVIERRLVERGVHLDNLRDMMHGVELDLVKVSSSGETQDNGQSVLVQISIVMILYITLVVYGVMTMRSVVEEKTTRIVEILASSVKPAQLLTGKIVGIAAVGLTQYLIWILLVGVATSFSAAMGVSFSTRVQHLHLPMADLIYPLVYFLAGYFLYASFYAAIGSMVSSEEESQQVQMPLTLLLVACFILYPIIQRAPNSPLAIALTLFPFSSPILMVYRITVQTPPFWQIALSLAICVATTAAVIQLSARIYRVGILMYGKRPSLAEVVKWLRYT